MTVHFDDLSLDWFGYATLRISDGETVVYLDPGRYGVLDGTWTPDSEGVGHPSGPPFAPHDADLVCVTHDHHYDADGIERVSDDDTTVIAWDAVESDRGGATLEALAPESLRVGHDESFTMGGVTVRTIPAHNHPDGPHVRADGTPYHPEGLGCGFLVALGGTTVLWPGDTDVLDAHSGLVVDVFCPPIGGSFTMDREDAAALAEELEPGLVLPIHYNTFAALETDSGAFAADVAKRGIPVVLDEQRWE